MGEMTGLRLQYPKEYAAWCNIKSRMKPNHPQYEDYGGRSISMCGEWRKSFSRFLSDIGPAPNPEYTIDRINNDGNYEPGNVRWATWGQQVSNRRPLGVTGKKYIVKSMTKGRYLVILPKKRYWGSYDSLEHAVEARDAGLKSGVRTFAQYRKELRK